MGVAGHADHVAHRQQAAPTGESLAGRGFEIVEGGGHDDGRRVTRCAAPSFPLASTARKRSVQAVVVALGAGCGCRAEPPPRRVLRPRQEFGPRDCTCQGRPTWPTRPLGWRGLRGSTTRARRDIPSTVLLAQRQSAAAGAILVAEYPVRVEVIGEPGLRPCAPARGDIR